MSDNSDTPEGNKAKSLVEKYWKLANPKSITINKEEKFADGTIYFISILDKNNAEHENYVYSYGVRMLRFSNLDEVVLGIGASSGPYGILISAIETTGVTGVLAFMIFLTICAEMRYPVTNMNPDVFKLLSLSLTTILGFYFGSIKKNKR